MISWSTMYRKCIAISIQGFLVYGLISQTDKPLLELGTLDLPKFEGHGRQASLHFLTRQRAVVLIKAIPHKAWVGHRGTDRSEHWRLCQIVCF